MAVFGYDTVGGTSAGFGADEKVACKFTAPSDIGEVEVDSISIYANRTATGGGYSIAGGIYTDNAGAPDTLLANSEIELAANISRNNPQWYSINYVTKPSLTPGNVYWLCYHAEKAVLRYYDAGATNQLANQITDTYADGLADPYGSVGSYNNDEMSIYVSYTPPPSSGDANTFLLAGD